MIIYPHDIEIFKDFFLDVFYNYKTKEWYIFEISKFRDDRKELKDFILGKGIYKDLNKKICLVGYNSKDFDDPLLYNILVKYPNCTVEEIKEIANEMINGPKFGNKYSVVPWKLYSPKFIDQGIDMMNVLNMGVTSAKTTSLKKWEFNLREKSIMDLPYAHDSSIDSQAKREKVIKYCKNDVLITTEILLLNKDQIDIRREFSKLSGLNHINDSEVSLAKRYITKVFSNKLGLEEKEFKKLRTYHDQIAVKDIITQKLFTGENEFKATKHKKLLEYYNSQILLPTRKSLNRPSKKVFSLTSLKHIIEYKSGLVTEYGSGGIHGVVESGIYESDDEYDLTDLDFASYYPHLVANYNLDPDHLPNGALGKQLMEWYTERKTKYPKKTHFSINYAYKIIMNLCYGQMGSEYSPLFDQKGQLAVCINGMLHLTKLTEMVFELGGEVLYQNTK